MQFTFPSCGNPAAPEASTDRVCKLWERNKKKGAEKRPIPHRS